MNTILYDIQNRVATITLNRPEKRNALSNELVQELSIALSIAEGDDFVKAIILKGNGNTFCSGADLDQLQAMQTNSFEENLEDSTRIKDLFKKIYTLNKIVVAQVEGFALAGGCGLATICDFTFCTPESKFGYTEARIGFVPAIVMVFLVRKLGEKKAGKLLLGAEIINAEEAFQFGLVNQVFAKEKIDEQVSLFVQNIITQNSSSSMAATKNMLSEIGSKSLDDALDYAAKQNALARETQDCKAGIKSFLEKKSLKW